jgi:hypothetical protein
MTMNNSSKQLLTLLLAFALWPGIAAAQGDAAAAPLNAHVSWPSPFGPASPRHRVMPPQRLSTLT